MGSVKFFKMKNGRVNLPFLKIASRFNMAQDNIPNDWDQQA
jgi:hypothetical protein